MPRWYGPRGSGRVPRGDGLRRKWQSVPGRAWAAAALLGLATCARPAPCAAPGRRARVPPPAMPAPRRAAPRSSPSSSPSADPAAVGGRDRRARRARRRRRARGAGSVPARRPARRADRPRAGRARQARRRAEPRRADRVHAPPPRAARARRRTPAVARIAAAAADALLGAGPARQRCGRARRCARAALANACAYSQLELLFRAFERGVPEACVRGRQARATPATCARFEQQLGRLPIQ